jgi:hypothetical protein
MMPRTSWRFKIFIKNKKSPHLDRCKNDSQFFSETNRFSQFVILDPLRITTDGTEMQG